MTEPEPHLTIENISKRYGETEVLGDLSLGIARGSFTALLGPSGCGKSTLLKIIAGLEPQTAGRIRLAGRPLDGVPAHRRDIGVVFQSYALFPHLTVAENIRFGLDMRDMPRPEAAARVAEALALVRLEGLERRMPADLSGGQQQRVAIARALAIRPQLLLLDEPLSNLDAVLRKSVRVELRDLHERAGTTTIMVTHDQEEAMSMADRLAVMTAGRVEQWGSPEAVFERPATRFVAGFVGNPAMNLVTARRRHDGGWTIGGETWIPDLTIDWRMRAAARIELVLGLRPERLTLAPTGTADAIAAVLRSVEYLGGGRLLHAACGDQRIVLLHAGSPPAVGETLWVRPDPDAFLLFDPATGARIDPP